MKNIQSMLITSTGTSYLLQILMDMPTPSLMIECGEKPDLLKGEIALVLIQTEIGTSTGEVG